MTIVTEIKKEHFSPCELNSSWSQKRTIQSSDQHKTNPLISLKKLPTSPLFSELQNYNPTERPPTRSRWLKKITT